MAAPAGLAAALPGYRLPTGSAWTIARRGEQLPSPRKADAGGDRRRAAAVLAAASLAAVGSLACGSQSSTSLDAGEATRLGYELHAAQAAAGRGQRQATLSELERFLARVRRLAASGALPAGEAAALSLGGTRAIAAARRELPEPVPAVAQQPPAATPAQPEALPSRHRRHRRGEGHGGRRHREDLEGAEGE